MTRYLIGAGTVAACLSAQAAWAECPAGPGSIRLLGNDFEALTVVTDEVRACASGDLRVEANLTTEHKNIQVAAMQIDPSEYTAAFVANNSIVPLMNDGLIRPLDDLVAEYGQDLAPNQLIRVGGQVVAIAFMANTQHLFLRGDILEEAGIEQPGTYEEILEAAEAIRSAGLMEYPLAATDEAGWYLAAEFVNMYLGMGGEFFEPGSAEPAIENDAAAATLEMMKAMTEYMTPEFLTVTADEMNNLYNGGNVAIMNQWGSVVNGVIGEGAPSAEIAEATILAPAPTVAGGETPAAALWWDGFVIASNVSDEDAAASFRALVHAIRPEIAAENPTVATWLVKNFEAPESAEGVLGTAMGGARSYPMSPYMGLMHTALGAELPQFMQGSEGAERALADVSSSYRTSAREAGYLN